MHVIFHVKNSWNRWISRCIYSIDRGNIILWSQSLSFVLDNDICEYLNIRQVPQYQASSNGWKLHHKSYKWHMRKQATDTILYHTWTDRSTYRNQNTYMHNTLVVVLGKNVQLKWYSKDCTDLEHMSTIQAFRLCIRYSTGRLWVLFFSLMCVV